MSGNYEWELSSENYDLVYHYALFIEINRDTGVSKKEHLYLLFIFVCTVSYILFTAKILNKSYICLECYFVTYIEYN